MLCKTTGRLIPIPPSPPPPYHRQGRSQMACSVYEAVLPLYSWTSNITDAVWIESCNILGDPSTFRVLNTFTSRQGIRSQKSLIFTFIPIKFVFLNFFIHAMNTQERSDNCTARLQFERMPETYQKLQSR